MNSHFRSYILMSGLHPPKKPHGSGQLACTCQMAQLSITSLNSHFPLRELSTEFGSLVSRGKVWIKVIYTSRETMRTLHINA